MNPLLVWLYLAQSADISTTAVALNRGCVEKTYWSGNPAVIAGGKIAGTVTLTFGLPKKSKVSKGLMVGLASATTTAAILNARTLGRCQ